MIHVIFTVQLKPGAREKFLAEFRQIIATVRAERGCSEYGPAVDAETDVTAQVRNPEQVVIVEKWADLACLRAHSSAPHMQAYRPRVKDYVVSTSLQILDPA